MVPGHQLLRAVTVNMICRFNLLALPFLSVLISFQPSFAQQDNTSCEIGSVGSAKKETVKINCGFTATEFKLIVSDYEGLQANAPGTEASDAKKLLVDFAHRYRIHEDVLLSYFRILGQKGISEPELFDKFLEVAARHKKVLDHPASAIRSESPQVVNLLEQADAASKNGDFIAAQRAVSEALKAQRTWTKQAPGDAGEGDLSAAKIIARNGELSLCQLSYHEAASYFGAAAETTPPAFEGDRLEHLINQAGALEAYAEVSRTYEPLEQVIGLYGQVLAGLDRTQTPMKWARIQNNLGNAYSILGERDGDRTRLEAAVVAFKAALEERTRDRDPHNWAGTQNNLGSVLSILGELSGDRTQLESAVAAHKAAIEEWTRESAPLNWAMTQSFLGDALTVLGRQFDDKTQLEAAVAAYRAALEEQSRVRVPLDWAMTQNNLGIVLSILGERNGDRAQLEAAVAAYRAALEEQSPDRVPIDWAMTQNNLAIALQDLGSKLNKLDILLESRESTRLARDGYREIAGTRYEPYFKNRLEELGKLIENLQN